MAVLRLSRSHPAGERGALFVTAGLGVQEGGGPGITYGVLPMRHRQGINVTEMRPEHLAQVTEPGRPASELYHVQHEGVDPGGLVHSGGEVRYESY